MGGPRHIYAGVHIKTRENLHYVSPLIGAYLITQKANGCIRIHPHLQHFPTPLHLAIQLSFWAFTVDAARISRHASSSLRL